MHRCLVVDGEMKAKLSIWFWGLLLAVSPLLGVTAEETRPLVVGTREAPPFAMKGPDGEWTGLSIDLWTDVAKRLDLEFEWREMGEPETLIDAVADGSIDASVAAITVTAERARRVDFSQPYYTAGFGIVVPVSERSNWWATISAFFSVDFLKVVAALSFVLLLAAFGVWMFERKTNAEQFGGNLAQGLGAAFWWSAVTMTTVGYGDKSPRTMGGRLVALVWMFASVIIISGFTAQIASSLTHHRMDSDLRGPSDLPRFTVATVNLSTAQSYLEHLGVRTISLPDVDSVLRAVSAGDAAAAVYDEPILQYKLRGHPKLQLLPGIFERRDYAIALPLKSPMRKEINIRVLEQTQSDLWRFQVESYLGKR